MNSQPLFRMSNEGAHKKCIPPNTDGHEKWSSLTCVCPSFFEIRNDARRIPLRSLKDSRSQNPWKEIGKGLPFVYSSSLFIFRLLSLFHQRMC